MHWRETKSLAELEASNSNNENDINLFDPIHLNVKKLDPTSQARFFSMYVNDGTISKKYLDQINDSNKSHSPISKRRSRKNKEQIPESHIQVKTSKFLNKFLQQPLDGIDNNLFHDLSSAIKVQKKFKNELSISNQLYTLALQRFRNYNSEFSEILPKVPIESHIDDYNDNEKFLKFKIPQKLIDSSIAILVENSDNIPLDFQQDIPHNISSFSPLQETIQDVNKNEQNLLTSNQNNQSNDNNSHTNES